MTRPEDRQILIRDIAQARVEGARLAPACALAGIDARTLQRWKAGEGLTRGDRRPDANHPVPSHALSEAERAQIVAVANEPRFADTPPARIVPALADEGIYIASKSSFHRVLRAHGQMNPRGRAQPPRTSRPPTTHIATRRSASLLSRPDLAAPKPRRATQEMGGAEPPGATRRAPWRTSMARLASAGPSPQVSTVAHSAPVGGSHLQTSTLQAQRHRQSGIIVTGFKRQLR